VQGGLEESKRAFLGKSFTKKRETRKKMAKELIFKGKNENDLKNMSINDYTLITNSRQRRVLKRGYNTEQKKLLEKIRKFKSGLYKKNIKTHCRDFIVTPELLGLTIYIYSGKEFVPVNITFEMLGHYLGEFVLTRRKVQHSTPGVGATRSSSGAAAKK